MKMESVSIAPDFYPFEVLSPPYSIKGLQYGLEIEQVVYDRLSASIYVGFARRRAEASVYSPVSLDGFVFDHWRGNLSLNYRIVNFLTIGIGYNYNQLRNLTHTFQKQKYDKFKPLMIDQGLNISIRGTWKNIVLKGYFHKGINSNKSDSAYELSIKPINYFGFSLGYRLKILNDFKRSKKAACPTF